MSNEIITKDNDRVKRFFQSIEPMLDKVKVVPKEWRETW